MKGEGKMVRILRSEWLEKGKELFGEDFWDWEFVCPVCGTIQSAIDFFEAKVESARISNYLGFSCIGRFTGAGPYKKNGPQQKGCDWTLGGLFHLHRLEVIDEQGVIHPVFEFAAGEEKKEADQKSKKDGENADEQKTNSVSHL
jgi:hypothetical protein